jgi:hypothetical protein
MLMMEGKIPETEVLITEIIDQAIKYYEGNEDNELVVDPLMFQAVFLMQ